MKTENIPADIKSKSLKDARDEIKVILTKLENQDTDLDASINDYKRLIQLNNHIAELLRKNLKKFQEKK